MSDRDPFLATEVADLQWKAIEEAAHAMWQHTTFSKERCMQLARMSVEAVWPVLAIDPDPASLRAELAETQRRLDQADRNWEAALGQLAELRRAAAALLAEVDGEGGSHATLKAARDWVAALLEGKGGTGKVDP